MAINFFPNDPLSLNDAPMRQQVPRPDRSGDSARVQVDGNITEDTYDPFTPEFLFWQCREGVLAAIDACETADQKLQRWAKNRQTLRVVPNLRQELNAFYNRIQVRLEFFEHTTGNKTTFSGASTDVTAHELGHAFVDAIRPEFGAGFIEFSAFHEGAGDMVAILTALADPSIRRKVLQAGGLESGNFVESWGEDLSDGVRRAFGAGSPAAEPRHALNDLQYQLPSSLPSFGGPGDLTKGPHSFGRIFTGCFYDLISNIFAAQPSQTEAKLKASAETAGKLLFAAIRTAPAVQRLFQSVGNSMLEADQLQNGGTNSEAIRTAFAGHSITLNAAPGPAPLAALAGPAPKSKEGVAGGMTISRATKDDLRKKLATKPGARMSYHTIAMAGENLVEAVHMRDVSLGNLDKRLRGVISRVPESAVIGGSGGQAALFAAIPQADTTKDEAESYVETLLDLGSIDFGDDDQQAAIAGGGATHKIRKVQGRKVLERVGFACSSSDIHGLHACSH